MSIRQAQQEIDAREFAAWVAFLGRDPQGVERHEVWYAILASLLYNANRGKEKAKSPQDFIKMVGFGRKAPRRTSIEEFRKQLNVLDAALKGNRHGRKSRRTRSRSVHREHGPV
jgi:hypothetical protein